MSGLFVKGSRQPDETRPFIDRGKAEIVHLGERTVGRGTFEPGWRWSQHVKPIAGTRSCEASHYGYCLSGSMRIRMDDGEEQEIRAGDSFRIEPGHDAWVTSQENCVMVDFSGFEHYAEPRGARPTAEKEGAPLH